MWRKHKITKRTRLKVALYAKTAFPASNRGFRALRLTRSKVPARRDCTDFGVSAFPRFSVSDLDFWTFGCLDFSHRQSTIVVMTQRRDFASRLDLRPEFTALHFLIDDITYQNLRSAVRLHGDVDFDNDVDLSDLQRMAECLGPLKDGDADNGCAEADLNSDDVVDLRDFASLQNGFMP